MSLRDEMQGKCTSPFNDTLNSRQNFTIIDCYVVCLTLKESTGNDESGDIPKTITELYKRAVKVLIYRHHPLYKLEPPQTDYLITPLPEELENELLKLKEVAQSGIIDGKLIF